MPLLIKKSLKQHRENKFEEISQKSKLNSLMFLGEKHFVKLLLEGCMRNEKKKQSWYKLFLVIYLMWKILNKMKI